MASSNIILSFLLGKRILNVFIAVMSSGRRPQILVSLPARLDHVISKTYRIIKGLNTGGFVL